MLFVDRNKVEIPKYFFSKEREASEEEMVNFFSQRSVQKKQRSFYFSEHINRDTDISSTLVRLFSGKCAYCESRLNDTNYVDIDQFRPRLRAMNLDGTVHQDHYWWLAYNWNNQYSICPGCSRSKRTRFPVDGKRAKFKESTEKENKLLIDPCLQSDFDTLQFRISENGKLFPLTKNAEVSIDVYNLNRSELIDRRERAIKDVREFLESIVKNSYPDYKEVYSFIAKGTEFLSTRIAAFNYYKDSYLIKSHPKSEDELIQWMLQFKHASTMHHQEGQSLPNQSLQDNIAQVDVANIDTNDDYFATVKSIKRIEIKNFKIIRNLTIDFPKGQTQEEAWLTLLGENGSGKSSVLQALALTLGGPKHANNLGLDASEFVNKNTRSKDGYVRVYLEDNNKYLELSFHKDSSEFSFNYSDTKLILLAFGSTRLMSNDLNNVSENNVRNLHNLFNPFAPLPNVEQWIVDTDQVETVVFDEIAKELKKILQLPEDRLIYRRRVKEKNELFIKFDGDKQGTRISDLSAGYKTVIAVVLNIIREVLKTWDSFKVAEGIVLIDEIGVHLHPKWKMKIVSHLREVFPALTFVITTHEPLCLRGINKGEVALMKLDENKRVIALTDLPSPKSLTVEQLITSKFFGLITSFDPKVEKKLNTFYLLKSKMNPTDEDIEQLEELQRELEDVNMMDKELLMKNESLNDHLSQDYTSLDAGWVSNPSHQEEMSKKIQDIWKSL